MENELHLTEYNLKVIEKVIQAIAELTSNTKVLEKEIVRVREILIDHVKEEDGRMETLVRRTQYILDNQKEHTNKIENSPISEIHENIKNDREKFTGVADDIQKVLNTVILKLEEINKLISSSIILKTAKITSKWQFWGVAFASTCILIGVIIRYYK